MKSQKIKKYSNWKFEEQNIDLNFIKYHNCHPQIYVKETDKKFKNP